jgi:hypothetical protein
MKTLRILATVTLFAGVAAACGGDDGGSTIDTLVPTSAAPTTVAPSTTAAPTTTTGVTSSAAPTTAAGGTTTPGQTTTPGESTTTAVCNVPTETKTVTVNFPGAPSTTAHGDDVDTGGHGCFERFVLTFAATGSTMPGYSIGYMPDPLTLAVSGQPTQLKGEANLIIRVGAWMGDQGQFTGEKQLFPTNVGKIMEVTLIDNSEGVMIWGIGLDKQRPFQVFKLKDPLRLVIDIAATD